LCDEQLRLAIARKDRREESIAHNAKAIAQMGRGELIKAKDSFARAIAVAQECGFRRREAIALHNFGLVLAELDERDQAKDAQQRYIALSAAIGNIVARA